MKNVQIPEDLFWELCRFHLGEPMESEEAVEVLQTIDQGLTAKLEAMQRRELFSQFKRAAIPAEREAARIAYLDEIGMRESFRASQPPPEPPY